RPRRAGANAPRAAPASPLYRARPRLCRVAALGGRGDVSAMEAALDRLIVVLGKISRATAWIAGLLLTLAALAIGFDIAIRYFLNRTIGGGNELAGYALALASAWGITATLLQRAHVRIDTVYVHLPARARALLDIVALLSFV